MKKQIEKNKISPPVLKKFIFFVLVLFLFGYWIRINLVVPLFLISLYVYFKFRHLEANLLNLTLLFLVAFAISYFVIYEKAEIIYIPFSLVPMLTTLLFNNLEISLMIVLATAISSAAISNNPTHVGMLFLISGILSSIFVKGARKRMANIRAGVMVGFAQVMTLFFLEQLRVGEVHRYLVLMLNGIICSIVVLGVLPIFEYLFKTITNISLLELIDTPLLNRMKLEASGTAYHSLIVGNLSETASEAIGANALLARIGAYYHDIGKLHKPEYFSENQEQRQSKHDTLPPSMSKLVIINHVREGVELAKKYKLNPLLIDFILQHHGTSLAYYFYQRALENLERDEEIKEEGFRYPGPKPTTKETAIVLLADSVEAATRAMKEKTSAKIADVVHKVINNKFIDGQLDECDLTLKDLEKISAVFIHVLSGIYHSRTTYPEGGVSELPSS